MTTIAQRYNKWIGEIRPLKCKAKPKLKQFYAVDKMTPEQIDRWLKDFEDQNYIREKNDRVNDPFA